MEEMWLSAGGSFVGHDFTEQRGSKGSSLQILAKFASVALLGIWARRDYHRYRLVTTSFEEDVLSSSSASISPAPNTPWEKGSPVFRDFVTKQKVLTLTSTRPIHQRCIEEERLQIA